MEEFYKKIIQNEADHPLNEAYEFNELQQVKMMPYCLNSVQQMKIENEDKAAIEFNNCQKSIVETWNNFQLKIEWKMRKINMCTDHMKKSGMKSTNEIYKLCTSDLKETTKAFMDELKKENASLMAF